jgi:membrane-associated phospholipid phosphatase
MNEDTKNEFSAFQKLALMLIVALIHSSVWAFVNNFNSLRPSRDLWDLSTVIDKYIPYIGWTWVFYYGGHIFIITISAIAIWHFSKPDFIKIISLFSLMIITGGIIQLVIPAESPLPHQMNSVHALMHNNISHDPYVCFPSMHVSLAALPTFLLLSQSRSFLIKSILVIALILVIISTLTLKEHYFIDAIAGLLMSFLFFRMFNLKTSLKVKKRYERTGQKKFI